MERRVRLAIGTLGVGKGPIRSISQEGCLSDLITPTLSLPRPSEGRARYSRFGMT